MAELISITETAEAITAEAIAHVWEEYDAPRKRVKRARIVEHRFTVSIPKYTEDAAPLAFVVEHFPELTGRDSAIYRPGYDQPIRHVAGLFYTPVRMDYRHRHGTASQWESADPRERLTAQVSSIRAVSDHERTEYADKVARHEQRADEYPATTDRAEQVERQAEEIAQGLIVIGGELWQQCKEPAYVYSAPGWFSSKPGYILASTDYSETRDLQSVYGASDRIALAYHHATATRYGYIKVLRPELVTIDHTARKLAAESERKTSKADEIREQVVRLMRELEEAQAEANDARASLDSYTVNPHTFWTNKAAHLEDIEDGTPFKQWRSARAAAVRRELEMEA